MTRFTVTVAIPAHTHSAGLYESVCAAVEPHNRENHWNWWVVGSRWAGEWLLNPEARRIPEKQSAASSAGESRHTEAARKGEIESDSITASHAYIDLDGQWHHQGRNGWFVNRAASWAKDFRSWLQSLPSDVWLVKVDADI